VPDPADERRVRRGPRRSHRRRPPRNCHDIQDRILTIRAGNANIPDWFDNRRRTQYETSMSASTEHLIEEAPVAPRVVGGL